MSEIKSKLTAEENSLIKSWEKQPMLKPKIAKVIVNFAVGSSGADLEKARTLCTTITGQTPVDCRAKDSVRAWGVRKNEPIGVRVTLRNDDAVEFLKKVIWAKEDRIKKKSFDKSGNLSLGIAEHLNLPDIRYDPKIGVLGFGVSVTIERPGYAIKRRRHRRHKIPKSHQLTREESIALIKSKFNVEIEE